MTTSRMPSLSVWPTQSVQDTPRRRLPVRRVCVGALSTGPDAVHAFGVAYRHELVAIAGRDLSGEWSVEDVTTALADLAGHTVQTALAVARKAASFPVCHFASP